MVVENVSSAGAAPDITTTTVRTTAKPADTECAVISNFRTLVTPSSFLCNRWFAFVLAILCVLCVLSASVVTMEFDDRGAEGRCDRDHQSAGSGVFSIACPKVSDIITSPAGLREKSPVITLKSGRVAASCILDSRIGLLTLHGCGRAVWRRAAT